MGRGAWWAAVHGVAEGRTRLSDFTFTFHFHALEKEMATMSEQSSLFHVGGTVTSLAAEKSGCGALASTLQMLQTLGSLGSHVEYTLQ